MRAATHCAGACSCWQNSVWTSRSSSRSSTVATAKRRCCSRSLRARLSWCILSYLYLTLHRPTAHSMSRTVCAARQCVGCVPPNALEDHVHCAQDAQVGVDDSGDGARVVEQEPRREPRAESVRVQDGRRVSRGASFACACAALVCYGASRGALLLSSCTR